MSLQLRLVAAIAIIVFLSLLTNAFITSSVSTGEMHDALLEQFEKDLVSKRDIVKEEVEAYFTTIEQQVTALATNVATQEAAQQFIAAFNQYAQQRDLEPGSVAAHVTRYYENDFTAEYRNKNDRSVNTSSMLTGLDDESLLLQYDFISNNVHPVGNKDNLYNLNNGTDYATVHQKYHETFRTFLNNFGFYDIFIVDAQSGDIVYSVYKELDFTTSLRSGPYANSGIGEAFQNAVNLNPGSTWLTDFSAYLPSYNNPASFIATPISINGRTQAVLIFQMPIGRINALMTQQQRWQEKGFGESGEVYLVGEDKTLRNESRFLVEDKDGYIAALKRAGVQNTEQIALKNTSISLQPADSPGVNKALRGQSGFDIFEDYRGVSVLSAYAPVKIGQFEWAIMSEIDEAEAFAPAKVLTTKIWGYSTLITAIMIAGSIILSWLLAKMLIKPLVKISSEFQGLTSEDANLTTRIPKSGIPEIDRIATGFNEFIEQIRKIISIVKQSAEMISSASTELSATTEQTNQAARSQQHEAENVTQSILQFNAAIQEVTENSVIASNNTTEARARTVENSERASMTSENIGKLVQEVTHSAETLKKLQGEVGNINEVLNVINGIADQTNLLALNAAIEAARAGEHGRGFAVVADEVRQLASRTQESTVEIQEKIVQLTSVADDAVSSMERASDSADGGIKLVQAVNESLQQLNHQIDELATINQTVASASEEQKYTSDEIGRNVEQVRESSTELCSASDEIARSAVGLAEIASDLHEQVGRFRT